MKIEGWEYYNHAAIPCSAPHESVDTTSVDNKEIWKMDGKPILARWTTDFDCEEATNWWYLIKDEPFDLFALKSKRRYEINKGVKNFEVKKINPFQYKEELYTCQVKAFDTYPKKYRPTIYKDKFLEGLNSWKDYIVYGAFLREDNRLCGYSMIKKGEEHIDFSVQKTIPAFESAGVNAALIYGILEDQKDFLLNGGYICDGARSISHETHFQDYLEKYFVFRKAYCKIHVKYKTNIKILVKTLYPFRKILKKTDGIKFIHKINAILKMEEIIRQG